MISATFWARCIRFKVAILIALQVLCNHARAQNIPTAIGPGSYVAVGGEVSAFQADYGQRVLGGGVLFVDVNPTWRIGFEGEARYLRFNTLEDVTESNYLVGPRVMLKPGPFRPYVKFLVGAGKITLPFHYADGTFLSYAPGAGLDYLVNDRVTVRVIDFEYQFWPDFASYGELRPYGVSAGISFRLNPVEHIPKNARRARWH
jgi:opacity protein-like surface antigen